METIFIIIENSKSNESNKFIYQFIDKLNPKNPNNKNIWSVILSIYYTWRDIKSAYNNNKFKISALTWNDEFDLPDGSYFVSDIWDKQFGQLITISSHSLTMLKTTSVEFQCVELWFTDQNNRPLEIEYSVNITLILGRDYKNEIFNRTEI